jgi:myo-inositol 2-dehydrogenase/D-chiro-inositol 1-dehydrogenase
VHRPRPGCHHPLDRGDGADGDESGRQIDMPAGRVGERQRRRRMLNIGVIGAGNIGTDHARRLSRRISGARVAALFDVDAERARALADATGARVSASVAELIADQAVDAVVIASPSETHPEYAIACIAAGKPTLCEKPLAKTPGGCRTVMDAEIAAGRRFIQVGFQRRWDTGYRQVKAAIEDGSIGDVVVIHCIHRNADAPADHTSAMAMTDSVIHEIDASRFLLGEEIVAATVVPTRRSPLAPPMARDPQLVLLESESGVIVDVESFVTAQYGYDVRCEVVGSRGFATLENPVHGVSAREGHRGVAVPSDWLGRFAQAYHDELQDWVDATLRGETTGPSAWDGYAATAVAASCVASIERGGRVEVGLIEQPRFYA